MYVHLIRFAFSKPELKNQFRVIKRLGKTAAAYKRRTGATVAAIAQKFDANSRKKVENNNCFTVGRQRTNS